MLPIMLSEGVIELLGLSSNFLLLIRVIIGAIVALLCLNKKHVPGKIMLIFYIIYTTILFSSRFHGNLKTTVISLINSFVICVLFDYWLCHAYVDFICCLRKILFILIIFNLITVIIFKDGLYETYLYASNWILGQKNSHLTYIMMAIIIESIYSYNKFKKITLLSEIYMIVCCMSLYLVDAATGFMIVTIYVAFLIIFVNYSSHKYVRIILNLFNIEKIILVMLVLTVFIVFLQDESIITNNFGGLFDSMNRDISFTGRTVIWRKSIEIIKENLWLGQGVVNSVLFGKMTGIEAGTHAHNYILNILIMGGITCLVEHIILYVYIVKKIIDQKSFFSYSLGLAIGLYFIGGLTGVNFYSALFNPVFILTEYVLLHERNNIVQ